MKTILVTGGRGFIGSHFVELVLSQGYKVIDIDCLTYAANKDLPFLNHPNYTHINENICDLKYLPACDYLVHMAAESHVDNSISNSHEFIKTNIYGTYNLLELIRGKLYTDERPLFLFISTDEVYGDTLRGYGNTEQDILKPSNPYSASKAAADLMVQAWGRTYGLKYKIIRMTNNYGPRQHEEKFIPKSIKRMKEDKKILLHGDGTYLRDWLHVKDAVNAIMMVLIEGGENEIYNIAGGNEKSNLEVAQNIIYKLYPPIIKTIPAKYIQFTENRWGQDKRYFVNCNKIKQLGWEPKIDFNDGLEELINDCK